jgi:hypothetical protein
VQHLVKDMLVDLLDNYSDRPEIKGLPFIKFFAGDQGLDVYEKLDDNSIVSLVHLAADKEWGLSTDLAKRFLNRKNYKCFEIQSTPTGNIPRNKLDQFREALREQNVYFVDDFLSQRTYKQHAVTDSGFLKNILIKIDGEYESLGSVSSLLKGPAQRVARIYFRDDEDRSKAKDIFAGLH